MTELRVRLDDIARCEVVSTPAPDALEEGEALLRVDRFGLTANNVTYAVVGDELGYWRLFPAPEGSGCVPAWGYATVVESRAEGVAEGEQVFGIVPMAEQLRVRPQAAGGGFADAAPHRASLSPVYNQYLPAGEADDLAMVLRPLFGTSVLLDLWLADAGEAGPAVLTSASSKTALGLAHLLGKRGVEVVGLTSPPRVEWVEGLGLYDAVYGYEAHEALPAASLLVDFAGDRALRHRLHEQLEPSLQRSVAVGITHREALGSGSSPPGPQAEFFFAPDEMVRRGPGLGAAYAEAWSSFAPIAERALHIELVTGLEQVAQLWGELAAGRVDPAAAYVAQPRASSSA